MMTEGPRSLPLGKANRRATLAGTDCTSASWKLSEPPTCGEHGGGRLRSPSPSSLSTTSSPSRRTSFLQMQTGGMSSDLACISPVVGRSIQSLTSAIGKSSTMRARTKSTVSFDSPSAETSPMCQKRYHDISRGTAMANAKLISRGHRQLRPLRKGIIGLSETDLLALGERLRLSFYESGVIKNRRRGLVCHPSTFLAIDAVEWLVSHGKADTQQQAITIMTCLQRNQIIVNLSDERDFQATQVFFRFRADDISKPDSTIVDLVDCHTSNLLRSWATRDKRIITHHNRGNKVYPHSFVASELVSHLDELKDCPLAEDALVPLCQILQESRCIVQLHPVKPSMFANSVTMLFRFRQDHILLNRAKEVEQRRLKKSSALIPRWMSATESLSAAVRSPVRRAKTILRSRRRDTVPDRGQVYRPEMWDGIKLQLVASLKDEWGFTLHGTTPVRVSCVDKDGPARKLLKVGDIILQIDDLDVFRMTGQQVMSVIREGKPFCQVTIHQRPELPPTTRQARSIKLVTSHPPGKS